MSLDVHVDQISKKDVEKLWQMTEKSPFIQL